MKVCVGGTFDPFHVGHKALLGAAALQANHVYVGLTQGALASRSDRVVAPWDERRQRVVAYLAEVAPQVEVEVGRLVDPHGPAATGDYDAIAVSWDTVDGARAINRARAEAGLKPLAVRTVGPVLADDLLPVSATRVSAGVIDAAGRRLTPVHVAVGSGNPVKVEGVRQELEALLSNCKVEVTPLAVDSGVPEQPQGEETLTGARARAMRALEQVPEADYGVGVEAGLNRDEEGFFDVQCCVVVDATGHETRGWGPAFSYPDWVTRRALAGQMISDIVGPVAKDPQIGGTTGAIGFLTAGHLDRTALTRSAVLMAFVPRIRRGLYEVAPEA